MVGAVIGILCGGAGFFLLARLCHAVCHQARVPWMLALANPAALLLGLIFSVVHSQARITELNGQINDTRTGLTAAQSEYDYLSTKMSDITSRASLQDVAEGQLGLVKADQSQITYIQLEEQSVIEKTSDSASQLLLGIRTAALNLLGSLNP